MPKALEFHLISSFAGVHTGGSKFYELVCGKVIFDNGEEAYVVLRRFGKMAVSAKGGGSKIQTFKNLADAAGQFDKIYRDKQFRGGYSDEVNYPLGIFSSATGQSISLAGPTPSPKAWLNRYANTSQYDVIKSFFDNGEVGLTSDGSEVPYSASDNDDKPAEAPAKKDSSTMEQWGSW